MTKSFDLCLFERSNCYNHFVRGWSLVPVAPFIPIGKGARLDMQTSAEQDHIAAFLVIRAPTTRACR